MEWREADGVRWLEAALPGARAAFTTRSGGVSASPFDELNLGVFTDDERSSVLENRRRLAVALDFPTDRVAISRQVHGSGLIAHAGKAPLGWSLASYEGGSEQRGPGGDEAPEADGHVIGDAGTAGLVLVADCVPVALSGQKGVAILHCGWRGLAAGIIARGVGATGAVGAAIGPSVGPCCYEVGDEVLAAFAGLGGGIAAGRMLDLTEVTCRLLAEQGVEQIETSGLCTSCEAELFFSHRRDAGRTGRQAGLVWREREGA